ncbi:MAG TPA: hypothetical protein VMI32_17860 [Candidatus Solibacter sp.]|nr:hypothetical protein [Candidatus Solibacter sp.]
MTSIIPKHPSIVHPPGTRLHRSMCTYRYIDIFLDRAYSDKEAR